MISLFLNLHAIYCSVNSNSNDFSLSLPTVDHDLFFTMLNLKNIPMHM